MRREALKGEGLRILSLDSGDLRCMSELKILDEFMHRIQYDVGEPVKPCDYFDIITGVGASGVIAILLGVFGTSVDRASDAFLDLCREVFPAQEITPEERSERLVVATRRLLQELNVSEECRLYGDPSLTAECKVSVAYMSAVNMSDCRMLRSYESGHSSYNPTIMEAIQIAWANPGFFSPVRVGVALMQDNLISAVDGYSNPTYQAVKEAYEVFGGNTQMCCLLSLGVGKPMVRSMSIDRQDLLQTAVRDTETMAEQLGRRYSRLQVYFRLSADRNLEFGGVAVPVDNRLAKIVAYTSTYLETNAASTAMSLCIKSSRKAGHTTIEQLYRTRASGSRSSHNLPPLSAFFVGRKKPMADIVNVLQNGPEGEQRTAVVVGMSGSGKTQISLRYGYDYDDLYDHILFVDASSAESLQNGILTRVRALDKTLNPMTPREAIQLLAQPEGDISQNWLIIMDNADSLDADIRDFFPHCEHGAILITTRNPTLGNLSPEGTVHLDVMSPDEAVELLLATALGPTIRHAKSDRLSKAGETTTGHKDGSHASDTRPVIPSTDDDQRHAAEIVKLLGFLPVAIVQAGCYIRMQKCLPDYSNRLKNNRAKLLRKPAMGQRDKLKYDHSVYAAFDTTVGVLSSSALQLLSILSFVHFMDFPRPLFGVAASYGFEYDPQHLQKRGKDYRETVSLLKSLFHCDGKWDETVLDEVLEELQQYSMVTLVPVCSIVTLRFHPLIHAWAKDRLSPEESASFSAAAIRLLVCGTNMDDHYLWEHLIPHFKYISPFSEDLHPNDRGALAAVIRSYGESHELVRLWEDLYARIKKIYGEENLQTSQAALQLADAYGVNGEADKMEQMEREVVRIRKSLLEEGHPAILTAMANLARTLDGKRQFEASTEIALKVLEMRRADKGGDPREVVQALLDLALSRTLQGQYEPAITLLNEALEKITTLVGQAHPATIYVMERLYSCHLSHGDAARVEELGKEINSLKRQLYGGRHTKTLDAIASLALAYERQEKYAEAESHWRDVFEGRHEVSGDHHDATLHACHRLAMSIYSQKRYAEAEALWGEEERQRRIAHGSEDARTLEAIHWHARAIFEQSRYSEAEDMWRTELNGRRSVHGNEHIDTLGALHWLARSLHSQERYSESRKLWEEDVEVRFKVFGADSISSINALGWLSTAHYEEKRYERAEELRRQQLDARRRVQGDRHEDTMLTLFWLGRTIFEQGRYAEAEAVWRAELKDRLEVHGEIHGDTLDDYHWIGRATLSQGNLAEAEAVWRKGLEGRRKLHGDCHIETLNSAGWLSNALVAQEKYTEAEALRKEQWDGRRKIYGDVHEETLNALFMYAKSIFEQRDYPRAERLWREELESRRKLHGDVHKDTLDSLYWVARCLFEQRQYAAAEPVWREELAGRLKVHGELHTDTCDARHWLGRSLFVQGRLEESETLWREELAARGQLLGNEDITTMNTKGWIADLLFKQKRYAEAEALRREQWTGRQKVLGERHDETLTSQFWIARCLYEQTRYPEAQTLWKDEMAKREDRDGKPNKDRLDAMFWVAHVYFTTSCYKEAEDLWREELAGRRALNGDEDRDTLDAIQWLARSMHAQGRHEESEALWREEVAIRRKMSGDRDIGTLDAMRWLGVSLSEQKKYPECELVRKEQLASRREVSGRLDVTTMNDMFSLAKVLFEQEKFEEAGELWKEELECRREVHGNRHVDTLDALHWYGRVLYEQGHYEQAQKLWTEEVEGRPAVSGDEHPSTVRAREWLEKAGKQVWEVPEVPEVSEPGASAELAEETDRFDLSEPHQAQSGVAKTVVGTRSAMSSQQSLTASAPPAPRSPWIQRVQASGRRRLGRISHLFS